MTTLNEIDSTNSVLHWALHFFGTGTGIVIALSVGAVGAVLGFLGAIRQMAGNPPSPPPSSNPNEMYFKTLLYILFACFVMFLSCFAIFSSMVMKAYETDRSGLTSQITEYRAELAQAQTNRDEEQNQRAVQVKDIVTAPLVNLSQGTFPSSGIFYGDNLSVPERGGSQVNIVSYPTFDSAPINNALMGMKVQMNDAAARMNLLSDENKQITTQSQTVISTLNSSTNALIILANAVRVLADNQAQIQKQFDEFLKEFNPQPFNLTLSRSQGFLLNDIFIEVQFDGTIQLSMNGRPLSESSPGKYMIDEGDRTIIVSGQFDHKANLTTVSITEPLQPNRIKG